jgi:Plasmid pRiA4b ORF-3-like protein
VLVHGDYTLGDLNVVILIAMGWFGMHLHAFRFGSGFRLVEYGDIKSVRNHGTSMLDENSVTLKEVIRRTRQVFGYVYDFGDVWVHRIVVERIEPYNGRRKLPVCLAGARACPPEDCGGAPGYMNVLRVLEKASTPDDRSFREWVGDYDPKLFEIGEVNLAFGHPPGNDSAKRGQSDGNS